MKEGKFKIDFTCKDISEADDMVTIKYDNGLTDKPTDETMDKLSDLDFKIGKWYPIERLMEIEQV